MLGLIPRTSSSKRTKVNCVLAARYANALRPTAYSIFRRSNTISETRCSSMACAAITLPMPLKMLSGNSTKIGKAAALRDEADRGSGLALGLLICVRPIAVFGRLYSPRATRLRVSTSQLHATALPSAYLSQKLTQPLLTKYGGTRLNDARLIRK